jgi:pimeloyl-ACP methyl ester carboxylesterase
MHDYGKPSGPLLRLILTLLVCAACAPSSGAPASPRTLQVVIGERGTDVDVYAPAHAASVHDAVVLAHGFTRSRATMRGHAEALAAEGYWAIAPDLPYLLDSRDNAGALRKLVAQLAQGMTGTRIDRVVLVGYSAGGLSALLAADAPGVVAYVGLDPFDRPSHVGLDAARKLRVPAFVFRSPSGACNAYWIAEPWLEAFQDLAAHETLDGATHCDFESPTDSVCRFVCGRESPASQARVRAFILDAVREVLGSSGPPRH